MATSTTTPRSSRVGLPQRIATQRLVLRAWRRTDAPLLKNLIDANLEHLRQWMPWALKEPSSLTVIEQRIDKFDQRFRADSEWSYAVFSEGEKMLYGGIGMRRSNTKGALEIGFWLGQGWTKQGHATEAVNALVDAAMALPNIDAVRIHCDVRNAASSAVARRAGFVQTSTLKNDKFDPAAPVRDTAVWERTRLPVEPASAEDQKRGLFGWLKSLFS
jgi:RimJ/RimL family protein N-acetyltransferase